MQEYVDRYSPYDWRQHTQPRISLLCEIVAFLAVGSILMVL